MSFPGTKRPPAKMLASVYFSLCTVMRDTKISRSLICQEISPAAILHTEKECYIARSLYVAVKLNQIHQSLEILNNENGLLRSRNKQHGSID
jgi:hypothetical protein